MNASSEDVLLVEDDPKLAKTFSEALEEDDIHSCVALGANAVEVAVAWQPGLILLDAGSSYCMEGLAILEGLRRNRLTARLPVVILSGEHRQVRDRAAASTLRHRLLGAPGAEPGDTGEAGEAMVRRFSKGASPPRICGTASSQPDLNPIASARRVASDALRGIPEINASRTEIVAVLALAQLTRTLVCDFDMRPSGVFSVMDGRQLVGDSGNRCLA